MRLGYITSITFNSKHSMKDLLLHNLIDIEHKFDNTAIYDLFVTIMPENLFVTLCQLFKIMSKIKKSVKYF